MAAPNTSGVLRTAIADMQVGDYILAKYCSGTSGVAGTLYNLGFPADWVGASGFIEAPYTGSPTQGISGGNNDGVFYFIKTEKGLLISDRVIQNSISWDTLNSADYIQGKPWDSGNIIPTMTSNTAPSGVVNASSELSSSYAAWKAFNRTNTSGDGSDGWCPGATQGWISYEFPQEEVITQYTITGANTGNPNTYAPKTWTFEGWNGTSWEVLDQQLNQTGWATTEKRKFLISNPKSFIKYRLNITQNNGSSNGNTFVGELEMMDTVGIIRSLGGGNSYADANGNSSTTDKSLGAWPTDNEYEEYIVNMFNGADDVWHYGAGPATWIQETPITGFIDNAGSTLTNAARCLRGSSNKANWTGGTNSNSAATWAGFRPVFEYSE